MAAFFRRGTGLCVRCIHRELCRVIWRPQTALFSSKPPNRNQPRRTHIKKAKPQPAVDVAKLLEQLFSQRRPGTVPTAGKAQPAKASSMSAKPPATSSMRISASNVPLLSKTQPLLSVFPAASSFKQLDSVVKTVMSTFNPEPQPKPTSPKTQRTSYSLKKPQQSPQGFDADRVSNVTVPPTSRTTASTGSQAAEIEERTSAKTIETKVETATDLPFSAQVVKNLEMSSFSPATVEPSIANAIKSQVEPNLSSVDTLEFKATVVEGPVEPTVDVPAEEVQAKDIGSREVIVSHTPTVEPLTETAIESKVKDSNFTLEIPEGPVEPTIDITAAETKSTNSRVVNFLHTAILEPSREYTIEPPVEDRHFPVETLELGVAVVEGPAEPTINAIVGIAAETNSMDSGVVNISYITKEEPLAESNRTVEPAVEVSTISLESRATVSEGPVESTIDVTLDITAQNKNISSGVVDIPHTATVETLLEPTIEPSVEASTPTLETDVERSVKPTVDATVDASTRAVKTNSTDSGPPKPNLSHIGEEKPLIESTIDASVEARSSLLETLEGTAAVVGGPVEATVETEADRGAQTVQNNSIDSGMVDISPTATVEPSIETTVEPLVETSMPPVVVEGLIEPTVDAPTQAVQTNSTDSGGVNIVHSTKEEPLIEYSRIVEPAVEAFEGTVKPTIEDAGAEESSPLPLKNKLDCTLESTVESGNPSVGEGMNKPEQMTLESVTLHEVQVQVESFKTDELLQTKSTLDEKAEEQIQELLVQTGPGAAAETENSGEDEGEILTKALSKWDSLSEDLQELKGESGTLVKELLCHDPAVLSKTSSTSGPPAGADGASLQAEEKETEAESMTLELVTLAKVKAAVGGLETEVLQETRDALEKEAEVQAKEDTMEVRTVKEDVYGLKDTTEADILTLDSISETTDAIEAETSVMLEEAMFGSEQGLKQPPDQEPEQQDDVIDQEALKEVLTGQEVEEEGALDEALGTNKDLDPVQRLFLEKIREYNNMRRLNKGSLEVEADYEKSLSDETAKLKRLYGGGDLSSFPEFTFTEPNMDQDSK